MREMKDIFEVTNQRSCPASSTPLNAVMKSHKWYNFLKVTVNLNIHSLSAAY